jgi:hypothetical protein
VSGGIVDDLRVLFAHSDRDEIFARLATPSSVR